MEWEQVAENTFRLPVPGGWIYRYGTAIVFVADTAEWHK